MDPQPTVMFVREGELVEEDSWVYVWLRHAEQQPVIYVGGTGLPPAARAWLHLHHDDPEIGRIASAYPDAGGDRGDALDVYAFRIPGGVPRRAVRDAVIRRLKAAGELSRHYCGFPAVEMDEDTEVAAVAAAVIAKLPLNTAPA